MQQIIIGLTVSSVLVMSAHAETLVFPSTNDLPAAVVDKAVPPLNYAMPSYSPQQNQGYTFPPLQQPMAQQPTSSQQAAYNSPSSYTFPPLQQQSASSQTSTPSSTMSSMWSNPMGQFNQAMPLPTSPYTLPAMPMMTMPNMPSRMPIMSWPAYPTVQQNAATQPNYPTTPANAATLPTYPAATQQNTQQLQHLQSNLQNLQQQQTSLVSQTQQRLSDQEKLISNLQQQLQDAKQSKGSLEDKLLALQGELATSVKKAELDSCKAENSKLSDQVTEMSSQADTLLEVTQQFAELRQDFAKLENQNQQLADSLATQPAAITPAPQTLAALPIAQTQQTSAQSHNEAKPKAATPKVTKTTSSSPTAQTASESAAPVKPATEETVKTQAVASKTTPEPKTEPELATEVDPTQTITAKESAKPAPQTQETRAETPTKEQSAATLTNTMATEQSPEPSIHKAATPSTDTQLQFPAETVTEAGTTPSSTEPVAALNKATTPAIGQMTESSSAEANSVTKQAATKTDSKDAATTATNAVESAPIADDQDGIPSASDLCLQTPVNTEVNPLGCHDAATIRLDGIRFTDDSAILAPSSATALAKLNKVLQQHPSLHVEISGHTNQQTDRKANKKLSQQRAEVIMKDLQQQGIPKAQLRAKGYGDSQMDHTEEQQQQIELKILYWAD